MELTPAQKKEIIHELDTIKAKATDMEIASLDIETFDADSPFLCIYGQMTGGCTSLRARELYPKKYSAIGGLPITPLEKYLFNCSEIVGGQIIQYLKGEIETIEL